MMAYAQAKTSNKTMFSIIVAVLLAIGMFMCCSPRVTLMAWMKTALI